MRTIPICLLVLLATAAGAQGVDPIAAFRCEQAHANANYGEALRLCRPLAEQGLGDAQLILGELHQKGIGTPLNYGEAARWLGAAAQQGEPEAQFQIGMMRRYGTGVSQDLVEAFAWLTLAAEANHPDAGAARDLTAQRMSGSQVVSAQNLANQRRAALAAPPAQAAAPAAPARPAMTEREIVAGTQSRLAQLGYDPGPADGLMGRRTRSAIETYQANTGIPVDGRPTTALLDRLDASITARQAAAAPVVTPPAAQPQPAVAAPPAAVPQQAALPEVAAIEVPQAPAGFDPDTQHAVDELNARIARANAEGGANPRYLGQLRDLVARHDWPWRQLVFDDSFGDGDYTAGTIWTLAEGAFDAAAASGLTTRREAAMRHSVFGSIAVGPARRVTRSRCSPERRGCRSSCCAWVTAAKW